MLNFLYMDSNEKRWTQNKANHQRTVSDKDFDPDISHKIQMHWALPQGMISQQ